MEARSRAVLCAALVTTIVLAARGADGQERPSYTIPRLDVAVTVDGELTEAAWAEALLVEVPFEWRPGDNVPAPVRTEARLFYDDAFLYVAIHAFDPEPAAIRAHLSDRDTAFQDDFTGIVIDTFGDSRRAYELFVNPLGVQMDLVQDDVSGNEDSSWDAIWESAGRLTADGYQVEMAIPFNQLRFAATSGPRRWGLDVVRVWPRDQRRILRSQRVSRDRDCYLCQISWLVGFEGVEPGRNLEIDPTLTALRSQTREEWPHGPLDSNDTDVETGVTARWGITPNITLNGTLNPDFSQVEADSAQLDVNTQFALFYEEKRPFFLESADYFSTPIDAVYTRTVADPKWGARVTGKAGANAFGAFVAEDAVTNLIFPGAEGSELASLDSRHSAGVLRYRRDIGQASALGALVTTRQGEDGYSNLVFGVDGLMRLGEADVVRFQALRSETEYPGDVASEYGQPSGRLKDEAFDVSYRHDTRDWKWRAAYAELGRDFRADSGFVPQVDVRQAVAGLEHSWWGDDEDWWTRFEVGGDWDRTEDISGNLLEDEVEAWVEFDGPLQSFGFVGGGWRERVFEGHSFDQGFVNLYGFMRPSGSLELGLEANLGETTDYANARNADRVRLEPWVTWKPGRRTRIDLSHVYEHLDVAGGRLYRADLTRLRLLYQFNVRTFVRLVSQYRKVDRDLDLYLDAEDLELRDGQLFNQLLFSYKLNPQTVVFVGYSDTYLADDTVDLTQSNRALFVKLGYAWLM